MEALCQSMANILWNIGERQKVIVVLPGEIPHIPHSHSYFQDSVTEKLYFFEFIQLHDLQIFLKRYLYYVSVTCAQCSWFFGVLWFLFRISSPLLFKLIKKLCSIPPQSHSDLFTRPILYSQFVEDPGPGALLFLYSAVLTRGTTK